MWTLVRCLVLLLGLAAPVRAGTVNLAWNAPTTGPLPVEGYMVKWGTQPGTYTNVLVLGNVLAATVTVPDGVTAYFVVVAFIGEAISGPSNEVTATLADTSCVPPLGANAISIFPTNLVRTGSGGPGSRARLDFQLASPNSPITRVSIRANTTEIALLTGDNLTALAGLWFTMPTPRGTYPLTIQAANAVGCARVQSTEYTVVVP